MDTHFCPNGHGTFNIAKKVFGKVGGALAGAAAGGALKNPVAVVLGIVTGVAIGHYIDESVLPKCPTCQVALQVLDEGLA